MIFLASQSTLWLHFLVIEKKNEDTKNECKLYEFFSFDHTSYGNIWVWTVLFSPKLYIDCFN